jgi:hypothetical protein
MRPSRLRSLDLRLGGAKGPSSAIALEAEAANAPVATRAINSLRFIGNSPRLLCLNRQPPPPAQHNSFSVNCTKRGCFAIADRAAEHVAPRSAWPKRRSRRTAGLAKAALVCRLLRIGPSLRLTRERRISLISLRGRSARRGPSASRRHRAHHRLPPLRRPAGISPCLMSRRSYRSLRTHPRKLSDLRTSLLD